MAFSSIITLTTAGANTGPFNLYSDLDGFVIPFETGVGKAVLEAGYLSILIPDGTTSVRVKSTGLFCKNYITLVLPTTIFWENKQTGVPYVDSDLQIYKNTVLTVEEFVDNSGNFSITAGNSIVVNQNALGGIIGNYRLFVKNVTDDVVLYDNTTSPALIPATPVNTYSFTTVSGKSYFIGAYAEEL